MTEASDLGNRTEDDPCAEQEKTKWGESFRGRSEHPGWHGRKSWHGLVAVRVLRGQGCGMQSASTEKDGKDPGVSLEGLCISMVVEKDEEKWPSRREANWEMMWS